jgi:hypothetical protein
MPIEFACECGKKFKVADEYAGKRSKCTACGQPVVVPMPAPVPSADSPTDEDAAFRALTEGDDSEPAPRTTGGYAGAAPPAPRRAEPPPSARDTAHDMRARTTEMPKPSKPKKPTYRSSYDAPPERRWSPNWMKVGGGALAVVGGLVWLLVGMAAGYIYFYPFFLIPAGIFGIINGLLSRS